LFRFSLKKTPFRFLLFFIVPPSIDQPRVDVAVYVLLPPSFKTFSFADPDERDAELRHGARLYPELLRDFLVREQRQRPTPSQRTKSTSPSAA
jgi:hypothetical protein